MSVRLCDRLELRPGSKAPTVATVPSAQAFEGIRDQGNQTVFWAVVGNADSIVRDKRVGDKWFAARAIEESFAFALCFLLLNPIGLIVLLFEPINVVFIHAEILSEPQISGGSYPHRNRQRNVWPIKPSDMALKAAVLRGYGEADEQQSRAGKNDNPRHGPPRCQVRRLDRGSATFSAGHVATLLITDIGWVSLR